MIIDTTVESNETVILTMEIPTNATLDTTKVYTHSIVNDDNAAPPTLYPMRAWTRQFGTSSGTYAAALTTGDNGAIYMAGSARGDLDGQPISIGEEDAFLTKFNPDGTKVWTKLLGSTVINYATSLTIGSDGAIYMAGDFDLGGKTQPNNLAFLTIVG